MLDLNGNHPEALSNLGLVLGQMKQFSQAEESLRHALAHGPGHPGCRLAPRGRGVLLLQGSAEAALRRLEKALSLNRYDVRALALKTLVLAELDRKDDERWLSDPHRLVHLHRLAELGYSESRKTTPSSADSTYAPCARSGSRGLKGVGGG